MKRRIKEDSGYSAAFTHPDPMDPNDRVRQQTQSRPGNYPYDRPTSYGAPVGTDMQGAAYQRSPDVTPPKPRNKKASDEMPISAWEAADRALQTYEPGPQAPDAGGLGYGSHGRGGIGDSVEIDIDDVDPRDLFTAFMGPQEIEAPPDPESLLSLLSKLSPDIELIEPEGEGDPADTYSGREPGHVYAPGAEDDEENEDLDY